MQYRSANSDTAAGTFYGACLAGCLQSEESTWSQLHERLSVCLGVAVQAHDKLCQEGSSEPSA